MTSTIDVIEITDNPALHDVVETIRSKKKPAVLRQNGKVVAIVTPILDDAEAGESAAETAAAFAAFVHAAGSWKDFDAEQFKRENYEQRQISTRPPVKL